MTGVDQGEALAALAARVEAATGPDRELDALICELVELPMCVEPDCLPDVLRACIARTLDGSWPHDTESVPAYTASLDAAMTLVPEGHDWLRWSPGSMVVTLPRQPGDDEKSWTRTIERRGATPALALTAAALRALREHIQTNMEGERG